VENKIYCKNCRFFDKYSNSGKEIIEDGVNENKFTGITRVRWHFCRYDIENSDNSCLYFKKKTTFMYVLELFGLR